MICFLDKSVCLKSRCSDICIICTNSGMCSSLYWELSHLMYWWDNSVVKCMIAVGSSQHLVWVFLSQCSRYFEFFFHRNVLSKSPEILCQNKLIFYLWLGVPGNSKTMHCGILILQIYVMRYYREEQEITQVVQNTIWLLLLYTTVQGEWRYHYS